MTVAELIEKLRMIDQTSEVLIFDADSGGVESVTGYVYDDDNRTVQLYSDDTQ